jgi:hypothetical protein
MANINHPVAITQDTALRAATPQAVRPKATGALGRAQTPRPVVETEATIVEWVDDTFPAREGDAEVDLRVSQILEEAVEIAVSRGMHLNRVMEIVDKSYTKSIKDFGDHSQTAGEAADLNLCLVALCNRLGTTLDHETQVRMQRNRARGQDYYAMKTAQKTALGL